jgi:Tol biopolymer transport system component
VLTRLTFDDGYTVDPAISQDGALVAYASDRAGRGDLDVWVQQTVGGKPIRVTTDDVDERDPRFSPDGASLVFRSDRGEGGIYVMPTFGGEQPRLLVTGGREPSFSPDGRFVAYWTGSNVGFSGNYDAWTVPVAGGSPRPIKGLASARFPIWLADGRSLLVLASQARGSRDVHGWDWWIAPVDAGAPKKTGAYERLLQAGVTMNFPDIGPGAWDGSRVLFADRRFLWTVDLDAHAGLASSTVERLTFGTGRDSAPSTSANGTVAFMSTTSTNNVWELPLDGDQGTVKGSPRPLTEGAGFFTRPSASRDGRLVAYHVQFPRPSVVVKDTTTNTFTDVGVEGSNFGPALSPDGGLVAYEVGENVLVSPTKGGSARTLCTKCNIGDWTADGRAVAVMPMGPPSRIALVAVADNRQRDLIVSSRTVNRPHFSSDGRLVAFRVAASSSEGEAMIVARVPAEGPVRESDWITIGEPERDLRPCGWAPNRALLYFMSSRDGSRCLYALSVDPVTGRPQGVPFAVKHSHGGRNAWVGQSGVLSTGPGNALRSGSFLYDLPSLSGSIWTLTQK